MVIDLSAGFDSIVPTKGLRDPKYLATKQTE